MRVVEFLFLGGGVCWFFLRSGNCSGMELRTKERGFRSGINFSPNLPGCVYPSSSSSQALPALLHTERSLCCVEIVFVFPFQCCLSPNIPPFICALSLSKPFSTCHSSSWARSALSQGPFIALQRELSMFSCSSWLFCFPALTALEGAVNGGVFVPFASSQAQSGF